MQPYLATNWSIISTKHNIYYRTDMRTGETWVLPPCPHAHGTDIQHQCTLHTAFHTGFVRTLFTKTVLHIVCFLLPMNRILSIQTVFMIGQTLFTLLSHDCFNADIYIYIYIYLYIYTIRCTISRLRIKVRSDWFKSVIDLKGISLVVIVKLPS